MGLKQIFVSHGGSVGSSGGNNSAGCPMLPHRWSPGTAPAVVAAPGTFRKLRVRMNAAPGVGNSVTFTIQKNGVNTGIAVTISGTDVEATDFSNEESFVAGENIRLFRTHTAGSPAPSYAQISMEWEGTNDVDSIYGCQNGNNVIAANAFNSVFNGEGDWLTTFDFQQYHVLPVAGDLKDCYVQIDAPVGVGNSVTITTFKNGVAQDGGGGTPDTRVTISGGSAVTGHAGFTLPLAIGDLVHNQVTYVGTTRVRIGYGYRFTSGTAHRYVIAGHDNNMDESTVYGSPQETWESGWGGSEAVKLSIAGGSDFRIYGAIAKLQTAPGGVATRDIRVRKNQVDTDLVLHFGPTDTLVSSGVEVPVTSGDVISLRHNATGIPVAVDSILWYSLMGGGAAAPAPPLQKVTQQVVLTGYDEDADLPENQPPEIEDGEGEIGPDCAGDGPAPDGVNPPAGTLLTDARTPLAWMEFTLGGTTYRFASNAVNWTTRKEPRVARFGKVVRGLTDSQGQLELPSMTIDLIDHDRILRGLMLLTWMNTPVTVYVADFATVKAGGTPRTYFHGVLRRFRPTRGLGAQMVLESRLTLFTANGAEEKLIPQRLVTSQISDQNPTERVVDKAVPLWFGNCSDESKPAPHPLGVVPTKYIASETPSFLNDNLHKFLVGQMAVKFIQSVYLADVSVDPPTTRVAAPASYYDNVIFVPTRSVLMGNYTDQADERYVFIYGQDGHPAIELARQGRIPITVNLCGHEHIGDTTGEMWSNPGVIALALLNNKFVQEATLDWLTVLSLGSYTLFDTVAFDSVSSICATRGYKWAGGVGVDDQQQNWRDTVADLCRNGDFDFGENRHGQWFATMLDRTSTYDDAPVFVDSRHVLEDSLDIDPREDDVENEIRYVYERQYAESLHALNVEEGARPNRDP